MNVSDRIKQRMQALNLKAVNIVKLTGTSKGSVSQWVNGVSKPSGRNLIALCKALECQPDWLLYGKDQPITTENAQWIGDLEPWMSSHDRREEEVELPFFTEVELSAGDGTYVIQEHAGAKLRFMKSALKRSGVDPAHAVCVKVNGTSMEPVLPDGATVGVDTAKTTVKDGDMYAIDHDGMLRVKLMYRLPSGGMRLKSFNSEEYPDERYAAEQLYTMRVIGRIFWYSVLR